jgi:hypothetical protein
MTRSFRPTKRKLLVYGSEQDARLLEDGDDND